MANKPIRLALVGPCSSGKSTLSELLRARGYEVRQPAQEHSYVPDMWQKLSRPDLLIYLDVNVAAAAQRRPHTYGGPERMAEQQKRLAHARAHCDFYLDTSFLTPESVQEQVLAYLHQLPK
ncbi:MAG: hypothetical protein KJ063_18490 [Anaerolineae bacterium]|nr:hypothetical protein [Anaerolineae bacterium]